MARIRPRHRLVITLGILVALATVASSAPVGAASPGIAGRLGDNGTIRGIYIPGATNGGTTGTGRIVGVKTARQFSGNTLTPRTLANEARSAGASGSVRASNTGSVRAGEISTFRGGR